MRINPFKKVARLSCCNIYDKPGSSYAINIFILCLVFHRLFYFLDLTTSRLTQHHRRRQISIGVRDLAVAGVMSKMRDIEKESDPPTGLKEIDGSDIEGQLEEIDPATERKLVRKLDAFIIPVVMLLYLLSFLDR